MKALRNSKGFTLIELMIVVAIIGILAAIAIPNFIQYQLKSRQSEAKTNLGAIKVSLVAFNGERGCYIGVPAYGATVAPGAKTNQFPWLIPATSGTLNYCVAGGTFVAPAASAFSDLGFVPSGSVYYSYAVNTSNAALPVPQCVATGVNPAQATGVGAAAQTGFQATAASNLDGDGFVDVWGTSSDSGVGECAPAGTF